LKRVAYLVETKYKVVEMKLKGYSTRKIMDTLNIKNESQVKVWWKWYRNGETHRFNQQVGKQYFGMSTVNWTIFMWYLICNSLVFDSSMNHGFYDD
jgi:hypothetical protein